MATNTEKLGLKKPSQEDFYNVEDFNENFQKIDDFASRKDNPHGVTAKQVGAWATSSNGMIADSANADDLYHSGYFRVDSTFINTPTTPVAGDILLVFPWDVNSVLQIYSSGYSLWFRKAIYLVANARTWGDWKRIATISEVLPLSGGTLTGDTGVYRDGAYPQLYAGNDFNNRAALIYTDIATQLHCSIDAINTALLLNNERKVDLNNLLQLYTSSGATYKVYGEHNLPNPVRIATGSYVGTGTYGVDNQNTLTFDFDVKEVVIFKTLYNPSHNYGNFEENCYGDAKQEFLYGGSTFEVSNGNGNKGTTSFTMSGKTLSWYNPKNNEFQMNKSGVTYCYIAKG